jgi:hypothetical protein
MIYDFKTHALQSPVPALEYQGKKTGWLEEKTLALIPAFSPRRRNSNRASSNVVDDRPANPVARFQ